MSATVASIAEAEAALERKRLGQSLAEQAEQWSGSLRLFLERAWADALAIKDPFVAGWHIDAICEHLQAVSDGEIRRLAITVPPGTTKSTITSICWPAWEWTRDPRKRFLTASYDARLAQRFAVQARDLIRSEWFQIRWGGMFKLKKDENLKSEYANDRGGKRLAIGTSTGTGEHGDTIVIDDPHNAKEVLSDAQRDATIEWHDGTMSMRSVDPKKSAEVIIAQRLHERDLIGHVLSLEPERWTVLCLPEEYELHHKLRTPARVRLPSGKEIAGDPRTIEGELICPARVGPEEHAERALGLGPYRAAGQLQQRPAAREGEILRRRAWRFFPAAWLEDDNRHLLPKFTAIVQSWDTAFKDRTANDYVAGTLWGMHGMSLSLLDARVERMGLSKTKDAMRAMHERVEARWPGLPHWVLIEKSANGVEIIGELKREIRGVVPVVASTSKVARAEAAEPALEGGAIFLPGLEAPELPQGYDPAMTPAFAQSLVETCAVFPHGEHDDEVDSFTQAVNWTRRRGRPQTARITRPSGRLPRPGSLAGV